ncbi:MAG: hypothetical protein ABIK28_20740, partial [Planctomycetota bacterium]
MTHVKVGFRSLCFTMLLAILIVCTQTVYASNENRTDPVNELVSWQDKEVIRGEVLILFNAESKASDRAGVVSRHDGIWLREVADHVVRVRFDDTKQSLDEVMAAY